MGLMERTPIALAEAAEAVDVQGRAPAARPALSDEERRRREQAVRFAIASVGLERFTVSPEAEERARRFIAGEIDLAEFVQPG